MRVTLRSVAGSGSEPDWSDSSVKRELQFLVSHTVHHYALIKELLRREGFDPGAEFGVAPSTLQARDQQRHVHGKLAAGAGRIHPLLQPR